MPAKCVECGILISPNPGHAGICGRGLVCFICGEMFGLIHEKEWWVRMQGEYLDEAKNKRKLRPGGDYFS